MTGKRLAVGNAEMEWGKRTYVVAIINATPDSFSGDGIYAGEHVEDLAIGRAAQAMDEGADVIDIGGAPTFPGSSPVPVEVERDRISRVVRAVTTSVPLPVSVDTYRSAVAEAALDAGAHIVNSYWGLRLPDGTWNAELAKLVAEREVPLVLTHNRKAVPGTGPNGGYWRDVEYADLLADVRKELREQLDYAESLDIPRDSMIVDCGLGLGKTPSQNMDLFRNFGIMRELEAPIMLAHSRKNFIGEATGAAPADRDFATVAITALGIAAGADIIRVHNVRANKQAAQMIDALLRVPAGQA